MIWSLCLWATFLTAYPECVSDWPDLNRCNAVGADWLNRMRLYRDSQHLTDNIVYACKLKRLGETL